MLSDIEIIEEIVYGKLDYDFNEATGALDRIKRLLMEGQKPPTNSDYAAALKDLNKWVETASCYLPDSELDILRPIVQRLNSAKTPNCT